MSRPDICSHPGTKLTSVPNELRHSIHECYHADCEGAWDNPRFAGGIPDAVHRVNVQSDCPRYVFRPNRLIDPTTRSNLKVSAVGGHSNLTNGQALTVSQLFFILGRRLYARWLKHFGYQWIHLSVLWCTDHNYLNGCPLLSLLRANEPLIVHSTQSSLSFFEPDAAGSLK